MEQEPSFLQSSSKFNISNAMHQVREQLFQDKDVHKKIIELAPKGVPEDDQTVDIQITDFFSNDKPITGHYVKYLGVRQPTYFIARFFLTNRYQYLSLLFKERKNGTYILEIDDGTGLFRFDTARKPKIPRNAREKFQTTLNRIFSRY